MIGVTFVSAKKLNSTTSLCSIQSQLEQISYNYDMVFFIYMRAAPKVIPLILCCWPTTAEAGVGACCCCVTGSSREALQPRGI